MLELLVFGTIGWWVLTFVFIMSCIFCVEKVFWGWSTVCLVTYILFLQYIGKIDIFGFILNEPLTILGNILIYFIIGVVWSFVKWWLYIRRIVDKILLGKELFERNSVEKDPQRKSKDWNYQCRLHNLKKPILEENKSRISMWIAYWPLSIITSLLEDFVKRIAREIVEALRKLYQSMVDKAFKKIEHITKE